MFGCGLVKKVQTKLKILALMAKKGPLIKEFQQYLSTATNAHVGQNDYIISPATAFLKYTIEAKDAISLCARKFPKKSDGTYTKDSLDSLQYLTVATLPAIMGHFETFQRYLFAGIFDLSVYLNGFKIKSFIDKVSKDTSISIDLERLSAFRNIPMGSVGFIVADNLRNWHSPEKVNSYFKAFGLNFQFFSNDDIKRIKVLWQLRHSIVHTGGTLTLPDSQKCEDLISFGDTIIAFDKNFIYEVSRKLHPIIKKGVAGLEAEFKTKLKTEIPAEVTQKIDRFFEAKSSSIYW